MKIRKKVVLHKTFYIFTVFLYSEATYIRV